MALPTNADENNIIVFPVDRKPRRNKETSEFSAKEGKVIPFPVSKRVPHREYKIEDETGMQDLSKVGPWDWTEAERQEWNRLKDNNLADELLDSIENADSRHEKDFRYLSPNWDNSILSTLAPSEELYKILQEMDESIASSLSSHQDKWKQSELIRRLVESACEYGALVNSVLGDSGIDFSLGDVPVDYLNKYGEEELPDSIPAFYNGAHDVKHNPSSTGNNASNGSKRKP